jgi:hypothetical protein
MLPFQEFGSRLICEDIWRLELGSTTLFFYQQLNNWAKALEKACKFKDVPEDAVPSMAALSLAQSVHEKIQH